MDRYFNSEVIGIIETDADFNIVRANPGACKMLGYSAEEFLRLTWIDLTDPDDVQKTREHFEPIFQRGFIGTVLEVRYRTKFGQAVDVLLNTQAGSRGADGRPQNYIGFLMDITRQKAAEKKRLDG